MCLSFNTVVVYLEYQQKPYRCCTGHFTGGVGHFSAQDITFAAVISSCEKGQYLEAFQRSQKMVQLLDLKWHHIYTYVFIVFILYLFQGILCALIQVSFLHGC